MIGKATLIIVTIIGVSIIHYINNNSYSIFAGCKSQFEQTSYKYGYYSSRNCSPHNGYNLLIISVEKRGGAFSICLFPNSLCSCTIFFSWNQICRQHNRKIAHSFKILTIVVYLIWAWQKLQFKLILLPFLILDFIYCSCFCHCYCSIALPYCH